MPLILISGYPCSGKTYRSQQLLDFLTRKIHDATDPKTRCLSINHINDQSLGLQRDVYKEAKTEKDARATHYSAIKRALGRDTIVIADGLNYIKGFRYQLYCEARAVQTMSCVVHVGTPIEKCREMNEKLLEDGVKKENNSYERDVFDNLVFRYEEPNGMNRWDSPLFTVACDDEEPPCEAIWSAMIGSDGKTKVVKPNQATVTVPATESDYLYELDQTSQDILSRILQWQKDHAGEGSGQIVVEDETISLPPQGVSVPKLQRVRRQFISLNRQHKLPKSRIRASFIEYLNDNLD